ncbi:Peptidase A1 domain-containing protein [Aphelenchoides fujianensis]|nr:Peptidase A1 domain-containing protein [Aphelenchoides fujianensis]
MLRSITALILVLFLCWKIESARLVGRQHRKTAAEVRELNRAVRAHSRSNFVVGFPDNPILTSIRVGTPPKTFWVAVESGADDLWLFDPAYPNLDPDQSVYNVSDSSTGAAVGDFNETSEDRGLFGVAYTDVLDTNFASSFTQVLGAVRGSTAAGWTNPQFEFDGVLGLSWIPHDAAGLNASSSPILNLLAHLPTASSSRLFVLWLEDGTIAEVGRFFKFVVTFGEAPADLCDVPNFRFVPLAFDRPTETLGFVVDAFATGSYTNGTAMSAKVDTGLPLILAPYDHGVQEL